MLAELRWCACTAQIHVCAHPCMHIYVCAHWFWIAAPMLTCCECWLAVCAQQGTWKRRVSMRAHKWKNTFIFQKFTHMQMLCMLRISPPTPNTGSRTCTHSPWCSGMNTYTCTMYHIHMHACKACAHIVCKASTSAYSHTLCAFCV